LFLESVEEVEFQTILIENGSIFVGATNAILQFNDSLSMTRKFVTGPADDGDSCLAPRFCFEEEFCSENVRCANNYNSFLLAYRNRLLACGTLYRICNLLTLDDITQRFGNKLDLQCATPEKGKTISITSRNRTLPVAAAVYVNNSNPENDLLYLGRFQANEDSNIESSSINVLIAPSSEKNYFTLVDSSTVYLPEEYSSRRGLYHLAWTDSEYGYVLWTDDTNHTLKLTRYCNVIVSHFSRIQVEMDNVGTDQGLRTYTEITLDCNSNEISETKLIEAKIISDQLYMLFHNGSGNVAICSSNISDLNNRFNYVRTECWNTTNSSSAARALNRDGVAACRSIPRPDFNNEWVSFI